MALAVLGVAVVVVLASGMRPGYDAFGWMVWGKQVLHWNLNTDGAPSWKPLPFLFTLPYALFGTGQVWLWMVTAVAGALAGSVFAARIAYMLTGSCPRRPYAPFVAGAVAGVGVLGLDTYSHLVLIASSDPIIVTLCLAAIDCHLSRRPKMAFTMLVLASLGRPEAWAFAGLYAVWAWFRVPSMRALAVIGLAAIPAFWFTIPALTSKSWFISGDLALRTINAVNVIHGSKFVAILDRLRLLNGWPIEVAAVVGSVIAAVRRDLVALALVAAGCLWTAIEIAMALHGWSGANRYLLKPAAVAIVIAGYGAGRVLAFAPPAERDHGTLRAASIFGSILLVALLAGSLVPTAKRRVSTARSDITEARFAGRQIVRLQGVIAKDGGAAKIPLLRTAGHSGRTAEQARLGGRAQRRQRRLPAGQVNRQRQTNRLLQAPPQRLGDPPDPHREGRRFPLRRAAQGLHSEIRTRLDRTTRDHAAIGDRLQLRSTFDSAAALYDRARPQYPTQLLDALISHTGLRSADRVLKVGCATGIATRPLAERGFNGRMR